MTQYKFKNISAETIISDIDFMLNYKITLNEFCLKNNEIKTKKQLRAKILKELHRVELWLNEALKFLETIYKNCEIQIQYSKIV